VGFLRQGCNLVLDGDRKPECKLVFPDGRRRDSGLTHDAALTFARKAAHAFGVGENKTVSFNGELAKADTVGDGKKKGPKKAKA
jgi:CRISPR-associated protein Csb1